MNEDLRHLKILAICYYVSAALTLLGGLVVVPFILISSGLIAAESDSGEAVVAISMIWLIFAIAMVFVLVSAGAAFLTGRFLTRQKHRVFCMVIAAITCTSVPLGTILGVFTLVVLTKDSVKALFEGGSSSVPAPPPVAAPG